MSKKQTGETKLSRREQLRAERRRQTLLWNTILFGGGGLVILAIVYYFVANARPGPLPGEQVISDEGRGHVAEGTLLTFQHYPPSSGTHYPAPANWGVYTTPLPEGTFVHNLEHGGVVLLYTCPQDCPDLVQQFRDLVAKAPPESTFNEVKILVTPYEAQKMPTPIVALAWDHQLNLDKFDTALLLRWYQRFVNQGPELVP